MRCTPPTSTLFPYTTLFRSVLQPGQQPEPEQLREREPDHRSAMRIHVIRLDLGVGAVPQQPFDHGRDLTGRARFELADRKSTRLNSSHQIISYAVFCLKKTT